MKLSKATQDELTKHLEELREKHAKDSTTRDDLYNQIDALEQSIRKSEQSISDIKRLLRESSE